MQRVRTRERDSGDEAKRYLVLPTAHTRRLRTEDGIASSPLHDSALAMTERIVVKSRGRIRSGRLGVCVCV